MLVLMSIHLLALSSLDNLLVKNLINALEHNFMQATKTVIGILRIQNLYAILVINLILLAQ